MCIKNIIITWWMYHVNWKPYVHVTSWMDYVYYIDTFIVYTQKRISCVYTRDLLCMHNTLVHALGQGPQGPGTKKRRGPGPGTGPAPFWVPGPWGPWPRACTRVLCMHKRSLVYTQEILLCIHNKYVLILSYHIIILYYMIMLLNIVLYCYNIIFLCHIIILYYQFSRETHINVCFAN